MLKYKKGTGFLTKYVHVIFIENKLRFKIDLRLGIKMRGIVEVWHIPEYCDAQFLSGMYVIKFLTVMSIIDIEL